MTKKEKYDFIVPIGWGCLNAHNLRANKLQHESLPFDWIWIRDIPMVTAFLKSKFSDFMQKKNLLFLRHHGDADIYRDTLTKTEFWHDFMIGEEFNQSYEKNYQKYQRRINRLFYHIEHSQKILFVRFMRFFPDQEKTEEEFMFEHTPDAPEQTIKEFAEIQKLYPNKKIHLLVFYTWKKTHEFKEYDISPCIHICEMFNDEDKFGWKGDEKLIAKVLQRYDLTFKAKCRYGINTFIFKTRKLLLRLAAMCGSKLSKKQLKKRD